MPDHWWLNAKEVNTGPEVTTRHVIRRHLDGVGYIQDLFCSTTADQVGHGSHGRTHETDKPVFSGDG